MTLRSSIPALFASSILLVPAAALAISLPDSGTCGTSGTAFSVENTGAGTGLRATANSAGTALLGLASSGHGVDGESSSGDGVYGTSGSGFGVYGYSSSANGIVAENNDTNGSSATISSLSADATNGLAYWGTGGIIVTGGAWKPGGGMWGMYSDLRVKKDVSPLRWGLEELRGVRPVTYKYNGLGGTTDDGRQFVGVIAQELEGIFPSMVTSKKEKLRPSDDAETDVKVVDPSAFAYVLINAVKEQQEIIDRQEHRIASLERARGGSLSASMVSSGVGLGLAVGLLPLAFAARRRRKDSKPTS